MVCQLKGTLLETDLATCRRLRVPGEASLARAWLRSYADSVEEEGNGTTRWTRVMAVSVALLLDWYAR